jgi:hypothetical protein
MPVTLSQDQPGSKSLDKLGIADWENWRGLTPGCKTVMAEGSWREVGGGASLRPWSPLVQAGQAEASVATQTFGRDEPYAIP